jgi:hypothetical protein
VEGDKEHEGRSYRLLNALGSETVPDGKYMLNPETGQVELQWIQGIGSERAAAPQARLMSTVINGILTRRLPWGLVLLGVFLVVAVELLGVRSLSFAVGSYLSIGTTAAIFCGGLVKSLAERGRSESGEGEASPGALYASGLIAAGGIVGLLAIGVRLAETQGWLPPNSINLGERLGFDHTSALSSIAGMAVYAGLAYSLFHFARKPLR